MHKDFEEGDHALLARAVDEAGAFQQLYERYFARVYGYVAARISDRQDAEDVVSEIFLSVVRHLPGLRGRYPRSFAAWLFTIARNAVTDHYRRGATAKKITRLHASAPAEDAPTLDPQEAAHFRALIATLPERKREVIILKYYGGLRNQEIAEVLRLNEKTVAAHLSRALDELQTKLAPVKPALEPVTKGHHS